MKEVILTGLRANDQLTLGNYLGGILPIIKLQQQHADNYQINMFVPDLHSFTTPINHNQLQTNIKRNLQVYVASGLDLQNQNTFIYRQSHISAHSELCWILDCFTYMGEVGRMTQFKDKSENAENISVGLFNYPILMAADILLYNAKWVPVGEDQHQHLELCRDIATRMNNKFGDLFTVPAVTAEQIKFIQLDRGLRIRDLVDPTKKMSKSTTSPSAKILMSDAPELAYKKIMSATTDSLAYINFDWGKQPGISNLLQILSLLSGKSQAEVNQTWLGQTRYGDLKIVVAETVANFLSDFQQKIAQINEDEIMLKLRMSEAAMSEIAKQTLYRVHKALGLRV